MNAAADPFAELSEDSHPFRVFGQIQGWKERKRIPPNSWTLALAMNKGGICFTYSTLRLSQVSSG